jgi:hypothetical protein
MLVNIRQSARRHAPQYQNLRPIHLHGVMEPFQASWLRDAPTNSLYLRVFYLSENKHRTSATYIINCLAFITEMKSVYCAVRTGSLNKAVWASSLKGYLT